MPKDGSCRGSPSLTKIPSVLDIGVALYLYNGRDYILTPGTDHQPERKSMKRMVSSIAAVLFATAVSAQVIDNTSSRVQTSLDPGLKLLGTLIPKNVREIETSRWTLGCETIDREYSDYNAFKEYLPALGITRIRLQGGWARTEKDPGIYDFAWLDQIIDDALARGLEIWLETDYGNPAYEGGGGRTLKGGFPTSETALAAWDKWVEIMATRYKGKVRDWAMWNEPDINKAHTPSDIADFDIRTAEIIKRIIPDARIGALSLATLSPTFMEECLKRLAEKNKLDLFEWVIYHGYTMNPDTAYGNVEKIREVVKKYSPRLKLWQGENGTQSEWCQSGALAKYPWTELTQAKWDSRRMLGDIGHDVDSAVFTAVDLDYRTTDFHNGLVRYGLIKTAGAVEGFRVLKVKTAYYAVQNVVSVFNDALELIPDYPCEVTCEKSLAVFGHKIKKSGQQIVVFWDKSNIPANPNNTVPATLKIKGGVFRNPVWVDIITGNVYEIPTEKMVVDGDTVTFKDVPVYDAPTFITDKDAITFEESAELVYNRSKEKK